MISMNTCLNNPITALKLNGIIAELSRVFEHIISHDLQKLDVSRIAKGAFIVSVLLNAVLTNLSSAGISDSWKWLYLSNRTHSLQELFLKHCDIEGSLLLLYDLPCLQRLCFTDCFSTSRTRMEDDGQNEIVFRALNELRLDENDGACLALLRKFRLPGSCRIIIRTDTTGELQPTIDLVRELSVPQPCRMSITIGKDMTLNLQLGLAGETLRTLRLRRTIGEWYAWAEIVHIFRQIAAIDIDWDAGIRAAADDLIAVCGASPATRTLVFRGPACVE